MNKYVYTNVYIISMNILYIRIDKISKCTTHLKVELPIFVAIATFSAPLIMAVRRIVILTRQTNISGLLLLHHSMVETMAMVKKTPSHFEPTLLSESTTLPKTNIAPEKC